MSLYFPPIEFFYNLTNYIIKCTISHCFTIIYLFYYYYYYYFLILILLFFLHLAYCNCNTSVECVLSRTSTDQDVLAEFTIIPRSDTGYSPSYLRGDERNAVVKKIDKYRSVDRYTATYSKDLMRTGDPKPALIHSSNVLHVAKSTLKITVFAY